MSENMSDSCRDQNQKSELISSRSSVLEDYRHQMHPNVVRVVVADDDRLFVEGIGALINEWNEFELVGKVTDAESALKIAVENAPVILLIGVRMGGAQSVETIKKLASTDCDVRVIVLASSGEANDVLDALRAGAQGYGVRKSLGEDRLRGLLWGVVGGEVMLSGLGSGLLESLKALPSSSTGADPDGLLTKLTARERQILELLMEGESNAEIGRRLYLSEPTVKKNIGRVIEKLQVNNRVQAAVFAARHLNA